MILQKIQAAEDAMVLAFPVGLNNNAFVEPAQ